MSVKRLLLEVDSAELTEWMLVYRQDPWGGFRSDLQAGIVASTVANSMRGKGGKAFSAKDFMPKFEPPKKQGHAEMLATMKAFAHAHNARMK